MESKPYVDLTLKVMKDFGIEIINNNYQEFIIKVNQKYSGKNYRVESDYSQGAIFLCAHALGNEIDCVGLDINSLQGDKEILDILQRINVELLIDKKSNMKIKRIIV